VQTFTDEPNHCVRGLNNFRSNFFAKRSKLNDWRPVSQEDMYSYIVISFLMLLEVFLERLPKGVTSTTFFIGNIGTSTSDLTNSS
jgi:hypothetical protein